MTSPAGCRLVSPASPCSSNLFLPQSLLICGPILPGLKLQTSSVGVLSYPPTLGSAGGLSRNLSHLCLQLLLSVLLFGWLLIGLAVQPSPPHFCCLLSFCSLLKQFGTCFAVYSVYNVCASDEVDSSGLTTHLKSPAGIPRAGTSLRLFPP